MHVARVTSVINLITDFGEDYRGIVKREIFKRNPEAAVIDYGKVDEYSVWKTAHVLDVAYDRKPAAGREIFLCITDPGVGTEREHLVALTTNGSHVICPNNGIITYLADELTAIGVINLERIKRSTYSNTFHGRDIFGPTAAYLSLGKTIDDVADTLDRERLVLLDAKTPERHGDRIENAQVRYVDNYGDVILNVPKPLVETADAVQVAGESWPLRKTYASVPINSPVALCNSTGLLELAVNQGSAAKRLAVHEGDGVPVEIVRLR